VKQECGPWSIGRMGFAQKKHEWQSEACKLQSTEHRKCMNQAA